MRTLTDIIAEDPTLSDADALAAYLAQQPERIQTPIQTVRSYLSDEFLTVPIRKVIANPAAPENVRDGLTAFLDGLDNAVTFNGLNDKVYALAKQLVPVLVGQIPILTAQQAAAILAFIERGPAPATLDDVAAARLALAKDARLSALETYASGFRAAVMDAASIDELPGVPA